MIDGYVLNHFLGETNKGGLRWDLTEVRLLDVEESVAQFPDLKETNKFSTSLLLKT